MVRQQPPVQADIRKSIQAFKNQIPAARRLFQKKTFLIPPVAFADPSVLILPLEIGIFHDTFPDQHILHLTGQRLDRKDTAFCLFSACLP